jgi:uncharacterized protein YvpB
MQHKTLGSGRLCTLCFLLCIFLFATGCGAPSHGDASTASSVSSAVEDRAPSSSRPTVNEAASSAVSSSAPSEAPSSAPAVSPAPPSSAPPIESAAPSEPPKPAGRRLQVPVILQNPELPVGCEVTALAMALNYAGYAVDKTTLSDQYLPKSSAWFYVGEKRYGPDFRKVFAGDPRRKGGCECDSPAIEKAGKDYLAAVGSSQTARNLTGSKPAVLYDYVAAGTPVITWITIGMADRVFSGGWYVKETEEYIQWAKVDHCAVLTGFDDQTVYFSDPLLGEVTFSRARFEDVYAQRGNQAVVITDP